MIDYTKVPLYTIAGLLLFAIVVRTQAIPGSPGVDYPNYPSIPETSFQCSQQIHVPGLYADLETKCQVFHLCLINREESFLCPTGTTFNQAILQCDSWYNSNCSLSPLLYNVNSGPLMESAKRNIPMLMKLRNLAQSKTSIRTPSDNVYDKIASLYGSSTDVLDMDGTDSSLVDINAEAGPQVFFPGNKLDAMLSETTDSTSESQLGGLARREARVQSSEESQDLYLSDTEENTGSNLLYDPVTEQYYMHYDSSENDWQQDTGDETDRFSFLDYKNLANKYGQDLHDGRSSESEVLTPSVLDVLNSMGNLETRERELFSKRILRTEQSSKRVRRKPIYTVTRDESEVSGGVPDSEEVLSTETSQPAAEVGSETPEGTETEERTEVPFVMTDDLRYPYFTPLNTSEVPLTSEEFEHAIIHELVEPRVHEMNLRLLATTADQQSDQGSLDDMIVMEDDYQPEYIEGVMTEDYDHLSIDTSEGDTVIVRSEPNLENDEREWYGDKKGAVEVDNTYVVIPDDELDNVMDKYSETRESKDISGDATYYSVQSDEANDGHAVYGSYSFNPAETFPYYEPPRYRRPESDYRRPESYRRKTKVDREQHVNRGSSYLRYRFPDESSYVADSAEMNADELQSYYGDRYTTYVPRAGYVPHAYEQSMRFGDYINDTPDGYWYARASFNPYFQHGAMNPGYGIVESDNSRESFIPDSVSESGVPFWVRADSNEDSEMNDQQLGVAYGSIPKTGDFPNLYEDPNYGESLDEVQAPEDVEVVSLDDYENTKDETYYILNFDENGAKEAEMSDADSLNIDLIESKESLHTESSQEVRNSDVGDGSTGMDEASKVKAEHFDVSKGGESTSNSESKQVTDSWPFLSTESSTSENPVTLSIALERLAGLQAVKAPRVVDANEASVSSGSRFLDSMSSPEIINFDSYDVAANIGQRYSIINSPASSEENIFSHRKGDSGLPKASKLSDLQERIRSLKEGKFGAFKKLVSSTGNKE